MSSTAPRSTQLRRDVRRAFRLGRRRLHHGSVCAVPPRRLHRRREPSLHEGPRGHPSQGHLPRQRAEQSGRRCRSRRRDREARRRRSGRRRDQVAADETSGRVALQESAESAQRVEAEDSPDVLAPLAVPSRFRAARAPARGQRARRRAREAPRALVREPGSVVAEREPNATGMGARTTSRTTTARVQAPGRPSGWSARNVSRSPKQPSRAARSAPRPRHQVAVVALPVAREKPHRGPEVVRTRDDVEASRRGDARRTPSRGPPRGRSRGRIAFPLWHTESTARSTIASVGVGTL